MECRPSHRRSGRRLPSDLVYALLDKTSVGASRSRRVALVTHLESHLSRDQMSATGAGGRPAWCSCLPFNSAVNARRLRFAMTHSYELSCGRAGVSTIPGQVHPRHLGLRGLSTLSSAYLSVVRLGPLHVPLRRPERKQSLDQVTSYRCFRAQGSLAVTALLHRGQGKTRIDPAWGEQKCSMIRSIGFDPRYTV